MFPAQTAMLPGPEVFSDQEVGRECKYYVSNLIDYVLDGIRRNDRRKTTRTIQTAETMITYYLTDFSGFFLLLWLCLND